MSDQETVAAFVDEHDLTAPPAFRLLDLVSEVGEVAKNTTESTEYGADPEGLTVERDELGDVLFALLALADSLDIDAAAALEESLEKYAARIEERDTPGSGA